MRTTFGDCSHGSEMQCSAILENLCEVSVAEGHLPQEFTIAADNTRKETKHSVLHVVLDLAAVRIVRLTAELHQCHIPPRGPHA